MTKDTKFKFGDCVNIVKGFYRGQIGKVKSFDGKQRYWIELISRKLEPYNTIIYVHQDYLELNEKLSLMTIPDVIVPMDTKKKDWWWWFR